MNMIMYGSPGVGKTISMLQLMSDEVARKYSDRPDEEFWAWLEETLSPEDYQQCGAQPIAFVRKLHMAAWRSHLAEMHAAEVARILKGNPLPGDLKVNHLDTEQAFDPDWASQITPLF